MTRPFVVGTPAHTAAWRTSASGPPGTNGDHANNLVVDIGGGRYLLMGHLKQGSVTVQVGDVVRRGQPLVTVGNSGHTNEPHLHLQIQDSPTGTEDADRTYPMVFRNGGITRGGPWPLGDSRELRTGDLVRGLGLGLRSASPPTLVGRGGGLELLR